MPLLYHKDPFSLYTHPVLGSHLKPFGMLMDHAKLREVVLKHAKRSCPHSVFLSLIKGACPHSVFLSIIKRSCPHRALVIDKGFLSPQGSCH